MEDVNDKRKVACGPVSTRSECYLRCRCKPRIRLYDLRHSHATLLLSENEHPKVVSERLGHSSITLTLDTYSHVLPTMQEATTQMLERLHYGKKKVAV